MKIARNTPPLVGGDGWRPRPSLPRLNAGAHGCLRDVADTLVVGAVALQPRPPEAPPLSVGKRVKMATTKMDVSVVAIFTGAVVWAACTNRRPWSGITSMLCRSHPYVAHASANTCHSATSTAPTRTAVLYVTHRMI